MPGETSWYPIPDPRFPQRFLLHRIARRCCAAGLVMPGALVFERVAKVGVFDHQREVDAFSFDR